MTATIQTSPSVTLSRNELGVAHIVFLVLAAVAPLTGMVVVASIGMAVGNGGGMAASFVVVTAVMLCFAVGYGQMSKTMVSAGGFYAYTVRALGNRAGLVSGLIALLGYNGFVIGAFGTTGFFFQAILGPLIGVEIPWVTWSLIMGAAAWIFTRQGVSFSAKFLGVSLVLEMAVLLVLDFVILSRTGFAIRAFSPQAIGQGSLGLGLLFAANAFVGFEATGLFSEEAKEPGKTIPKATIIAISLIGAFATFTTWAFISALGVMETQSVALEHLAAGDLVFAIADAYLGPGYTFVMQLLLLVSLFAALLALHSSATRYLYALGRARVLPQWLSRTRSLNGAPVNASLVQIALSLAVVGVFAVVGADPMTSLVPAMTGFGTLGIISLQLLAAIAIIVNFRRNRDPRIWSTLVMPSIGALGLAVIVTLAIANFGTMAGSDSPVIAALPWLLPIAVIVGLVYSQILKRTRPVTYAGLGNDIEALAS
ncbi:APC family permease [Brooklawnia sp.]|uniref:APC family permease n=1 Tax=Brooklawnia sp. TaxID=2699740 RepID=UPI00311D48FB